MDKYGSCVQLHRWSECVLQIEKVLNYFVFEQTNSRKINDDCQRKLSLYFLMDGGWFSARREIVFFFVFDKQNDAEQNLLLHYPIFAQIDCTLLLTLMPFYFTEGHCDLIVFFCTVHKTNPRLRLLQQLPNSAFEIWAIVKETSNFHASLESSPSNCILLVSLHSDWAQWIHCRAWCCKKVHLIKKPITPKCFVQFVWFIKAIVHLFFCEKKKQIPDSAEESYLHQLS